MPDSNAVERSMRAVDLGRKNYLFVGSQASAEQPCLGDRFKTDRDARSATARALEREGAIAFMRGNNVIPFRQG